MDFRQNHDRGKRAVALLATCVVVLGGAATCAAILLIGERDRQQSTWLSNVSIIGACIVVFWLLRVHPPENRAKASWSWLGRKRRRKIVYRAEARLAPSQRSSAGPPAPPTVESIRALTGRTTTWVPAATVPPDRRS